MRVAHLLRPAQGGMLQQVRSLLTDPEIATFLAAPPRELAALGEVLAQPGYPLPENDSLKQQLWAGRAVGRWARSLGIELLHGHGLKRLPLYVVAAKTARLPLVVTLHNLVPQEKTALVRLLLRQAQVVVAVSRAVAKTAPLPCNVIYNGIDVGRFAHLPTRYEARAELGWPQEARVVLSVARLSPEKGLDVLQDAVKDTGLTLYIAGEGPERAHLEPTSLLGKREDIPLLLAAADLYCQPSREEGLGLAVLEAMAAGLPIVASAVGGIPELLPDAGTGLLVPEDDVRALRAALSLLDREDWRRRDMGSLARQRVEEHFTQETMRQAYRALYQQVRRT